METPGWWLADLHDRDANSPVGILFRAPIIQRDEKSTRLNGNHI